MLMQHSAFRTTIPVKNWQTFIQTDSVTMRYTSAATVMPVCLCHCKCYVHVRKPRHFSRQLCLGAKNQHSNSATIFSLSSGYGKCGVAVIRVSGPNVTEVLRQIGQFSITPPPRQAVLRKLKNPCTGETIDRGIVLFFPSKLFYPYSRTSMARTLMARLPWLFRTCA